MPDKFEVPRCLCTPDERQTLDTIKMWPDIGALVTWNEVYGWSLSTPPEEMRRREEQLTRSQALLDEEIGQIYKRVQAAWDVHKSEILSGKCGYSILGSRPIHHTPLMIIGANPGFDHEDAQGDAHIQESWPLSTYLDGDFYKMKDRLKDLLDCDSLRGPLRLAVATNFLFFKSKELKGNDPLAWLQVPSSTRRELEALCLTEVRRLIELLEPKRLLVLGMEAVDQHFADQECVVSDCKGHWLVANGQLWGRPATAIKHPTGARWAKEDWANAKAWVAEHF